MANDIREQTGVKQDWTEAASRRGILQAGLALVAGTTAVAASASAMPAPDARRVVAQADKIAQAVVQYQLTPKDGAQCNMCVNWEEPNACKIVAGTIVPTGWCVAYAPKSG